MAAESTAARADLVKRILPEMSLSSGSPSSLTGAPAPIPHYLNANGRAQYRFAIDGVAVFTGGAGTLALEGARALLEHGLAGLALWDIASPNEEALSTNGGVGGADPQAAYFNDDIRQLAADFSHVRISCTQVDVTSEESVSRAVEQTVAAHGAIDILCCFAGVVGNAHALDMSTTEWKRVMDVNLTGSFVSAKRVARQMVEQKRGGSVVFIASISGHTVNFPQPQAAYNVSKAGILHLTHSLAAEWAVHGIRVNSISPGYMDTILNEGEGLERVRKVWNGRNPMGRMGLPQELCGPLVLLCSAAGSFVNGSDLVVDGGASVF